MSLKIFKKMSIFSFSLSTGTICRKRAQKIQKKNAKMNLVPATKSNFFLFMDSVAGTKYGGFRYLLDNFQINFFHLKLA